MVFPVGKPSIGPGGVPTDFSWLMKGIHEWVCSLNGSG